MQPAVGSSDGKRGGTARDAENACTIYVGNLHPSVTTTALQEICAYFGRVEQVKLIKDKATGQNAGYGFVRFSDRRCASVGLQYLQGKVFYGQELKVNWAFQSHQREDTSTHWQVFVGDLGQEVTDGMLFAAFAELPGCSDARVMWDHATGRSKGYGFVSIRTKEEAQQAIERMHGVTIGSRRVRCGWAQHKQEELHVPMEYQAVDKLDPVNCNVYVGNIAPDWPEPHIQQYFASFGAVAEVKLHKKGGYGFIRYERHEDAVCAIVNTHNKVFYDRPVKVSWGRNASGTRSKAAPGPPPARRNGPYLGPPPPQQPLLLPMMHGMGAYVGPQGAMPGLLGPHGVLQGAVPPPQGVPGRGLPPQQGPGGHGGPLQQQHQQPQQQQPVMVPGAMVQQGGLVLGSSQPGALAAAGGLVAGAAAGPMGGVLPGGMLPGMVPPQVVVPGGQVPVALGQGVAAGPSLMYGALAQQAPQLGGPPAAAGHPHAPGAMAEGGSPAAPVYAAAGPGGLYYPQVGLQYP